jgi:Uma2 family endonuclease
MAVAQRMSETDFVQFVQAGTEGLWELHNGRLVEKPGMSWEHLNIVMLLGYLLQRQLDRAEYRVVAEGRVRRPAATVFMPDIAVVPTSYGDEFRGRPGVLAIFSRPLPLVVEVWSASTGDYDVTAKLPVYQQRGDREIWLIHPYERRLTAWRRLPDGTYRETRFQEGIVHTETLPDVAIDLAELFDEE